MTTGYTCVLCGDAIPAGDLCGACGMEVGMNRRGYERERLAAARRKRGWRGPGACLAWVIPPTGDASGYCNVPTAATASGERPYRCDKHMREMLGPKRFQEWLRRRWAGELTPW